MEQLFGLPAHPLLIHAPVVLIPMLAVAAVVGAVRTKWAASLRWWYAAAAAVSFILLFLARESGEELDAAFDGVVDVREHASQANITTVMMLVWTALVVGAAVVASRRLRALPVAVSAAAAQPEPALVERVLFAAAAVLAVLTTIWLIRTGHSGAESHWKPIGDTYFP